MLKVAALVGLLATAGVGSAVACSPTQFDCGDGTCIEFTAVDDGVLDCPTAFDEGCYGLGCCLAADGRVGFRCNSDDSCIPASQQNNGAANCPNGEDECSNTGTCPEIAASGPASSSSGDPHFRSADGYFFDLQLLGKFVFCGTADFDIQTCQQPWVYNPTMAAVNQAVAIGKAGQGVFQIQYDNAIEAFRTLIDGVEQDLAMGSTVAVGTVGTVTRSPGAFSFVTAAGYSVRFETQTWSQWISVEISFGSVPVDTHGLCGSADGNANNDLKARDGTVYPPFSGDAAARLFGSSWRVSAAEDLFTGVECPISAPGYQPISLDALPHPAPTTFKSAREKAMSESRRVRAQQVGTDAQHDFIHAHINDVLACMDSEQLDTYYYFPTTPSEVNRRDRILQLVLDLLVFYNTPEGEPFGYSCVGDNRIVQGSSSSHDCSQVEYCHGHGQCLGSVAAGNLRCRCDPGWSGPTCDESFIISDANLDLQCSGSTQCMGGIVHSETNFVSISFSAGGSCL